MCLYINYVKSYDKMMFMSLLLVYPLGLRPHSLSLARPVASLPHIQPELARSAAALPLLCSDFPYDLASLSELAYGLTSPFLY